MKFEERFELLRDEYSSLKSNDFRDIDQEMIPYLDLLNNTPGIATTWSCSGHYVEYDDTLISEVYPNVRHVGFISKHTNPFLLSIIEIMESGKVVNLDLLRVELRMCNLICKFSEENYLCYFLEFSPTGVKTLPEFNRLCKNFMEEVYKVFLSKDN